MREGVPGYLERAGRRDNLSLCGMHVWDASAKRKANANFRIYINELTGGPVGIKPRTCMSLKSLVKHQVISGQNAENHCRTMPPSPASTKGAQKGSVQNLSHVWMYMDPARLQQVGWIRITGHNC